MKTPAVIRDIFTAHGETWIVVELDAEQHIITARELAQRESQWSLSIALKPEHRDQAEEP